VRWVAGAGHTERSLETMAVSPDGRLLAFAGTKGVVMLVNARTRQWVADVAANRPVRALQFSADGSRLFTLTGAPDAPLPWAKASG
jgi:WD40 repeat protein